MIKFFNMWGQGIIVAVVISIIIEMLIPGGNIKKYVKTITGIYILFTIISPIISFASKNKFDIGKIINTEKYQNIMDSESNVMSNKIMDEQKKSVKDLYEEKVKDNIKELINKERI